jgi:hypothetical protein
MVPMSLVPHRRVAVGWSLRIAHGGAEGVGSAMVDLALDRSSVRVGQLDGHD